MWRCLSQENGWRACCGAAGLQGAALKMYFEYDACFSSTLSFPGAAFGGFQEGKRRQLCSLLIRSFSPAGSLAFRSPFLSGAQSINTPLSPLSKHQTRNTHGLATRNNKAATGTEKNLLCKFYTDPSWNYVREVTLLPLPSASVRGYAEMNFPAAFQELSRAD
jgi:hypothetical protein